MPVARAVLFDDNSTGLTCPGDKRIGFHHWTQRRRGAELAVALYQIKPTTYGGSSSTPTCTFAVLGHPSLRYAVYLAFTPHPCFASCHGFIWL
jgi:hypothetical protein